MNNAFKETPGVSTKSPKSLKENKWSWLKKVLIPRSDEGIRTLSSFRGMQSGKKLSEAYKIIRHIE